jgi:hypothetical protein
MEGPSLFKNLVPALMLSCTALVGFPLIPPLVAATSKPVPAAHILFPQFLEELRHAVLSNDRRKVADMAILPFKDFSGGEADRTAKTRAEFLAHYDNIFTPAVVAAIRDKHVRAFKSGSDDGEAPGPIAKGEYLLDAEDRSAQLVFTPRGSSYGISRIPFYS